MSENIKDVIGREPCCEDDLGGSHYHCARCNKVSSMMGHYCSIHVVNGKMVVAEGHMCCPGDCELDA